MTDDERRTRDARLWVRNAIAELTVAINEAAGVFTAPDDKVMAGYINNARAAMAKAKEQTLRARILLEDNGNGGG